MKAPPSPFHFQEPAQGTAPDPFMETPIRDKLKNLPDSPGVYLFKDEGGEIIYVGKAKVLKDRVRSYFHASVTDGKVRAIIARAADLEWILTDSDVEALVLESTLVKKHKPRYNIDLKDDKRHPYLRITVNEPFPRIEVVRKVARDNAKYFGPYVEAGKMRRVLKLIEKVFQIRTCKAVLPAKPGTRPCLNLQIGECAGLCQGNVSENAYRERVRRALLFLSGKGDSLLKDIQSAMALAAENQDFESAAMLRDQAEAIRKVLFRQRMRLTDLADRDIIAAATGGRTACVAVFLMREGAVTGRHHFFLKLAGGEGLPEILHSFIRDRYQKEVDVPEELMVPVELEDRDTLEAWLREESGRPVRILQPQKGEKAKLLEVCARNAEMLLKDYLTERDKQIGKVPAAVLALKKELRLEKLPAKIEAYDISHIQGTETVASRVTFLNGVPRKSGYRHYNVKTVEGVDDFASMAEIMDRRIRAFKEEGDALPDLILVDGGKGQLSAVYGRLKEAGLGDQPVASLAKRLEEVFVPGQSDALMVPKKSPALHLLQRIRDEAHRFAITFHRKKRGDRMTSSRLDEIKGIGEKRKEALLKRFGSVEEILKKNESELVEAGVPEKIARLILQHIPKETP